MSVMVRAYTEADVPSMLAIWNEIVEEGLAFPQEEYLTVSTGQAFFAEQTHCGVAADASTGTIIGLYILHPNNVGRCGHIANASFAIRSDERGRGTGEKLVIDCLRAAKACGFRLMQFNAVVATNTAAMRLYERLGFKRLGRIPGGFRLKDGTYEAIYPYIKELCDDDS